ncbi:hypothetical protein MJH12_16780 [bacterium]|nr:hypothetical protein [bacterium]
MKLSEAIEIIKDSPYQYRKLPLKWKQNREVVFATLQTNPRLYKHLDDNYQKDLEVLDFIIETGLNIDGIIPEDIFTKPLALKIIESQKEDNRITCYQDFPLWLQSDLEIVNKVLDLDPRVYKQIPDTCKEDYEITKMMISVDANLYSSVPSAHKENIELLEIAIKGNGWNLLFAPIHFRKNEVLLKEAYKTTGHNGDLTFDHFNQIIRHDFEQNYIGYWADKNGGDNSFPQENKKNWKFHEKEKIVLYLKNGQILRTWMDYSYCRLECGIENSKMGSDDLTDGIWAWPEGYAHYVDKHFITLPSKFLEHIRSQNYINIGTSFMDKFPTSSDPSYHEWKKFIEEAKLT